MGADAASRRRFLAAALASAAMPRLLHARAGGAKYRIGVLNPGTQPADLSGPLTENLRDLGYIEGQNLTWEHRFADVRYERLTALAAELAALKPDLIATVGTAAALAARRATTTIPIVAIGAGDPVGAGLARTLSRPGGNVTGVANVEGELTAKRVELLKALVPSVERTAFFFNPENPVHLAGLPALQPEIERLGVRITTIPVSSAHEIEAAFARTRKERIDAICIPQEALFTTQRKRFADLALAGRLPSVGGFWAFALAGCLAGFGQNPQESFRMSAQYIDRILNGALPGDLPFLRADKLDLSLNLKTAAALSITVPPALMYRADQVFR